MTYEDILRIDSYRKGFRALGDCGIRRVKMVLIDGMKQVDVAKLDGVSPEAVSCKIRKAKYVAKKLGIHYAS